MRSSSPKVVSSHLRRSRGVARGGRGEVEYRKGQVAMSAVPVAGNSS